MASIHIPIAHALSKHDAQKRIAGMLKKVKKEYGESITDLAESWEGDTGTFQLRRAALPFPERSR